MQGNSLGGAVVDQDHLRRYLGEAARNYPRLPIPPGVVHEAVGRLLSTAAWRRCMEMISSLARRSGGSAGFDRAVQIVVDETIANREKSANGRLQIPPLAETMIATLGCALGDYRTLDYVGIGLYETARDLKLTRHSLLFSKLERLKSLSRGHRDAASDTTVGAPRGLTSGDTVDIGRVIPTDLANPYVFFAKLATGGLTMWRRGSPIGEDPFVEIHVRCEEATLDSTVIVDGPSSLSSWVRALILWFLHDTTRYVVQAVGIRFHVSVSARLTSNPHAGIVSCFWLDDIFVADVSANSAFLCTVPALAPVMLRTARLNPSSSQNASSAPRRKPIMTFTLIVARDYSVISRRPSSAAVLRCSDNEVWIETELVGMQAAVRYPASTTNYQATDALYHLRRNLLRRVADECLARLTRI